MGRIGIAVVVLPLMACHTLLPLDVREDASAPDQGTPDAPSRVDVATPLDDVSTPEGRPTSDVAPPLDKNPPDVAPKDAAPKDVAQPLDMPATCGPKVILSGGLGFNWAIESYPGGILILNGGKATWKTTSSTGAVFRPLAIPGKCRVEISLTASFNAGDLLVRFYPQVCPTISGCPLLGSYTRIFNGPQAGKVTYTVSTLSPLGYQMVCIERIKAGSTVTASDLTLKIMP